MKITSVSSAKGGSPRGKLGSSYLWPFWGLEHGYVPTVRQALRRQHFKNFCIFQKLKASGRNDDGTSKPTPVTGQGKISKVTTPSQTALP